MVKQAPGAGRILAMAAFAVSCIGILLYLWLAFGGSIPLRPEGYRVHVRFDEAARLAQEADVRISGVNVGKVKRTRRAPASGLTDAELELDSSFAPLALDARAVLRQKTLLGETYVELTPGSRGAPRLRDGGTLPPGQVAATVELDEVFRTFDPKTRAAFSDWMDAQGRALDGSGEALNDALGSLTPFVRDADAVLAILDRQERATRGLVRDTGAVFGALTERQGQLRDLIESSSRVFDTTAARERELGETVVALPTFLRETRATVRRLSEFARRTDPLITQLRPAARELSPALAEVERLSPDLRGLFAELGPLIRVARPGLPALERTLADARPLLARLDPYLRTLQPTFDYLALYRREIAAFFANDTAATQAADPSPASSGAVNYLRTTNPLNPEGLAAFPTRLRTNRSNPYVAPGGYDRLARGLEVLGPHLCTGGAPQPRLRDDDPLLEPELRRVVERFVLTDQGPQAPPCRPQRSLGALVAQPGVYPSLLPIGAAR